MNKTPCPYCKAPNCYWCFIDGERQFLETIEPACEKNWDYHTCPSDENDKENQN